MRNADATLLRGLHVHRAPADVNYIGLLPLGTEVTLSAPDHKHPKWAKIVAITHGKVVANDVAKPLDPAAQTGYVFIPDLDSIITPAPLDSVVVLDKPFPVEAGDLVGYLGEYQRYRDAQQTPPTPKRKLVHIEVFAGDAFQAFLTKSRERAAQLPAAQKNVLIVSAGAMFVEPAAHDATPSVSTGLLLKPTKDAPTTGPWTKVKPTSVSTAQTPHSQTTQTSNVAAVWVERDRSGTIMSADTKVWTSFPLQLSNAQAPIVGFQQAIPRSTFDALGGAYHAQDDHGVHWWQIVVGGEDGRAISGWVREKDHPNTKWDSPFAWPGYDVVDTSSVGMLDFAKRYFYVSDRLLEGEHEEFAASAASVNGSELVTKIEKAIAQPSKRMGQVNARDLASALTQPWLASALSHLIVRYDSEWGGEMSKWEALSPIMKTGKPIWEVELQRIAELRWWDSIPAGNNGFPSTSKVYHFHPIGLIGNFFDYDCDCAVRFKKISRIILKHEGGFSNRAADRGGRPITESLGLNGKPMQSKIWA